MDVIGSKVFVSVEDIAKIPAKVDTGAYTSSVWASNIREENGKLFFELFAPGSKFYTGRTIKRKNFSKTSVTSSNGHAEIRYVVFMHITIGDREFSTPFTLADRSGLTFPVLIGRRTLRKKFLVDVSQKSEVKLSNPTEGDN